MHGNGHHQLEAAATIRGLWALIFLDDHGSLPAFDEVAQLRARVGDLPVAVFSEYRPFVGRLNRHDLPGGVLYQVRHVPDIATANRCMEQVRAYRV